MNIVVSQKDKKLLIEFYSDAPLRAGRSPDFSVGVDKADEFLASLDRFLKKRKMDIKVLSPFGRSPVGGKKAGLEFVNVSILTERIIRAIIVGLHF